MSKPRELKHCFALIHKDAKKYEDWIIMGLPSPTGDDFDCVELREVTHESEAELADLMKDRDRLEWLFENEALVTSHRHEELYFCETRVRRNSFISVSGKTTREAIDAAMKESGGK